MVDAPGDPISRDMSCACVFFPASDICRIVNPNIT
jgi:hypothetical protein